jgi:AcrR family transcriptional regulator
MSSEVSEARGADHRSARESIWTRPEPSARRPGHSRESIARAAIRVADEEGFEAVSMRRVAAELGAGTMTLYHYVRTKGELLALVDNAIMGELLIPAEELPAGWRAGMTEIARRTRDAFVAHPWVIEMPKNLDDGPNSVRHFEQCMTVMAESGLGTAECLELILLVDDYVFGFVQRFNPINELGADGAARLVEEHADEVARRVAALDAQTFPRLHALLFADDPRESLGRLLSLMLDPVRFDRGLQLLLDGIEQRISGA